MNGRNSGVEPSGERIGRRIGSRLVSGVGSQYNVRVVPHYYYYLGVIFVYGILFDGRSGQTLSACYTIHECYIHYQNKFVAKARSGLILQLKRYALYLTNATIM